MAEIYALYSAKDGAVRYVGRTGNNGGMRFEQHHKRQTGRTISRVNHWMHCEWKAGFPTLQVIVERCDDRNAPDREKYWMCKFPGLLNIQGYRYDGGRPPQLHGIKKFRRNLMFNVDGYRGIHWFRQIDRYGIFVYDGCNGEWLSGDPAPSLLGDVEPVVTEGIYFLDSARALEVRDQWRHRRPRTWLSDVEVAAADEYCLTNGAGA